LTYFSVGLLTPEGSPLTVGGRARRLLFCKVLASHCPSPFE
jgi:serine/threonine protein kinase